MIDCPRIVIGGTESGAGKTSLTLALVAALRRRGTRVQTFKVGPDFLDPSYLAIASGRPCYNLDGWMMGRDYVERLVARATADADIAVIEGVMGLFDGADPDSLEGSTAEIASWLKAPVILVADVYGMARSLAAVVKGFATFERKVRVAGVIANHCGSVRHGIMLAEALQASRLPPMVAAVPRGALPELPSRHLGLVTADSRNLPPETLEALADAFEHYSALSEIVNMARSAPFLYVEAPERKRIAERVRLGVAHDTAFHFYYRDLLDDLEDSGCSIVRFSPVADRNLPDGLDAIYIGGGYPEEVAAELSANRRREGLCRLRPPRLCRVRRAHVPLPGNGDDGREATRHDGDSPGRDKDARRPAGAFLRQCDPQGGFPLGPCGRERPGSRVSPLDAHGKPRRR